VVCLRVKDKGCRNGTSRGKFSGGRSLLLSERSEGGPRLQPKDGMRTVPLLLVGRLLKNRHNAPNVRPLPDRWDLRGRRPSSGTCAKRLLKRTTSEGGYRKGGSHT